MLKTPRAHQLCLRSWPITGNLSKMEFQERLYLLILARRSDLRIADTVNAGRPLMAGVRSGMPTYG